MTASPIAEPTTDVTPPVLRENHQPVGAPSPAPALRPRLSRPGSHPRGHPTTLLTTRLGTVPYNEAWELQRTVANLRPQERIPNPLLLLEHPRACTRGRRGKPENIRLPEEE